MSDGASLPDNLTVCEGCGYALKNPCGTHDNRCGFWAFRQGAPDVRTMLAELHAKPPEANPAPDVAEAVRQDETTDRRVRASSAGGEEK